MSTALDSTNVGFITEISTIGALRKALEDNNVALAQTLSAALKVLVDARDVAIQALVAGNKATDCNSLP